MLNLKRLLHEFESEVNSVNTMVGSMVGIKRATVEEDAKWDKEVDLYNNLLAEELGEIFEAMDMPHGVSADVLFFDGIIDSLVIGSHLYALMTYGEKLWMIPMNTEQQSRFDDDKFYMENANQDMDLFLTRVKTLKEKAKGGRLTIEEIQFVMRSIIGIFSISFFQKADGHYRVLKEVTDSNWSKFPLVSQYTEEQALAACKTIEAKGRYTGVHYITAMSPKGMRYIFLSGEGKYLKCPDTFVEPDIKPYLLQD